MTVKWSLERHGLGGKTFNASVKVRPMMGDDVV